MTRTDLLVRYRIMLKRLELGPDMGAFPRQWVFRLIADFITDIEDLEEME